MKMLYLRLKKNWELMKVLKSLILKKITKKSYSITTDSTTGSSSDTETRLDELFFN